MCVITCHNVFNVGPKTTLLPPVWHRDAKRLEWSLLGRNENSMLPDFKLEMLIIMYNLLSLQCWLLIKAFN